MFYFIDKKVKTNPTIELVKVSTCNKNHVVDAVQCQDRAALARVIFSRSTARWQKSLTQRVHAYGDGG